MPIYKVDSVIQTIPEAFKGLDKTLFTTGGATVYMFHNPNFAPKVGDELIGTVQYDKRQNMQFKRDKQAVAVPVSPVTVPVAPDFAADTKSMPRPMPENAARTYKADPDKLKQELTLEQARNMSIQRQVALKGAVDLASITSGAYDVRLLQRIYFDLMELLSEPDWRELEQLKEIEDKVPDRLPTDAEVMRSAEELDVALEKAIAQDDTE